MRRRLLIALVAIGVIVVALAFVRFDLDAFREPLAEAVTEAAGRPVEVGGMWLRLLPLPYVEVRDLVVAGEKGDPPIVRAERVLVRPHVWPFLFRGQYVASVEIQQPIIHLEPEATAVPPIPVPGEVRGGEEAGEEVPPFSLESVQITDGVFEWGDVRVEALDASGRLTEDGTVGIEFDADVPGTMLLREVRVRYGPIGAERLATEVSGRIVVTDLGSLGRLFLDREDLSGKVSATFEVALDGERLTRVRVDAGAEEVGVGDLDLRLHGDVRVDGQPGGTVRVDATAMRIEMADAFRKKAGEKLEVRAPFPDEMPPKRIDGLVIEIAGVVVPLDVDLSGRSPRISIGATKISLEAVASLQPDPFPVRGTVEVVNRVKVIADPLTVSGPVLLNVTELPLRGGRVEVEGKLEGRGSELYSRSLRIKVWEQPFSFATTYGLRSGEVVIDGGTEGADVQTLGRAFLGRDELTGTLRASGVVRTKVPEEGVDPISAASADVRIEITDGRLRGFSLAKQVFGELAAVPFVVAALGGKDLSRYEEEEFEELSGDFRLRNGVVRTENLTIRYRHMTAQLWGTVTVPDGALDLAGKVTLSRSASADLAGGSRTKERVIPIAGIGGTVTKPRVKLDQRAILAIGQAYTEQDRVRKKLEEKLGPGGAEAIQDIFNQILGGQKREAR